MAGQRGRDIHISIGDGDEPEGFILVACIRARSISLTAGLIEATTAHSPDGWRELIGGAGVKRAEISGAGAFKDAASDALLRATYFAGDATTFLIEIPDFGTLTGPFLITELTYSGDHDHEAAFAVRLTSAGVVAFDVHGE
jgi:TP901-1 family phage major tail protein